MLRVAAIGISCTLLVAGCHSPYRQSTSAAGSARVVTVIDSVPPGDEWHMALTFEEVDGKKTSNYFRGLGPDTIQITPGRHQASVFYLHRTVRAMWNIEFDVQAHHNYQLHEVNPGDGISLYLVDEADGSRLPVRRLPD